MLILIETILSKEIFTSKVVFNPTEHATIERPSKNVLKRNPSSWARNSRADNATM